MPSTLIHAENITIKHNNLLILDHIDLKIQQGSIVAIIGPSGAGKSSLLQVLSQQKPPSSGTLHIQETHANNPVRHGILFQNSALLLNLNVFENVALPLRYHYPNLAECIITRVVMMKLHCVGLTAAAHKYPTELSGGMAKRAALARAIANDPEIIFYDEPFSGQDNINSAQIAKLIKTLNQHLHTTSILVSHEHTHTFDIADQLIVLAEKTIIAQGSPQSILHNQDPLVQMLINPHKKMEQ